VGRTGFGMKVGNPRAQSANAATLGIPTPPAKRLSEARDEAMGVCGREKFHWEKLYYLFL
jgi:hypothetical protein